MKSLLLLAVLASLRISEADIKQRVQYPDYNDDSSKRSNPNVKCTTSGSHQSHQTCTAGFPDTLSADVVELTIKDASLPSLGFAQNPSEPGFIESTTLQRLNLANCSITSIQPGIFGQVPKLKFLDLSYNGMTSVTQEAMTNLKFIEEINLSHNQIVLVTRPTFARMKFLTKLDLSSNQITELKISFPSSLTHLILSNNRLRELTDPLSLPQLEILDLCQNPLKSINASLQLPKVKNICIGNGNLNLGVDSMRQFNLPSLQDLSLRGRLAATQPLSADVCTIFNSFTQLHKIEFVDYSLTHINFLPLLIDCKQIMLQSVNVVQPLVPNCFVNAVELDLSGSQQLVREVITRTEIITSMTSIKTLILRNCDLLTLSWFTHIVHLSSLEHCDISNNEIKCEDKPTKEVLCEEVAKGPDSKLIGCDTLTCSNKEVSPSSYDIIMDPEAETSGHQTALEICIPDTTTPVETTATTTAYTLPPEGRTDAPPTEEEDWWKYYWIIGGIVGGIILLAIIVSVFWCCKSKKPKGYDYEVPSEQFQQPKK